MRESDSRAATPSEAISIPPATLKDSNRVLPAFNWNDAATSIRNNDGVITNVNWPLVSSKAPATVRLPRMSM